MNEDTTNTTGSGTTSGSGGEKSTTGQTNGTTSSGTDNQTQTSQQNSTSGGTTQTVKTEISALPSDIQDYIKRLRSENEQANKKAKDEETARSKAQEAKLLEEGKYKDLLDKRNAEFTTLQTQLADMQKQILVGKIVAKHKLPDDLAKLLVGATEAELEESASLLVKHVRPSGVNTEGGRGDGAGAGQNQNRPAGQNQNGNGQQTNKTYSFQRPGEVEWPS